MSDANDSDEALVARAGRGDRSAAAALIARHSSRVNALCRRLLNDRAGAEDAAQETFLKLWEQAARWEPRGVRLDTWLYKVASNACFDRMRRRKRDAPEAAAPDVADSASAADDLLVLEERARILREALATLPERQRIAMTLCCYQELSNIDAAAVMSISVEAVESLLSRARRSLREALASYRDELLEGC